MTSKIKNIVSRITIRLNNKRMLIRYYGRYKKNAFKDKECRNVTQYEAVITRLYHTIEKGLAYEDYRAGFGKDNVNSLIVCMKQYAATGYDITQAFYETALDTLYSYVEKNNEYGCENNKINKAISELPGKPNGLGGILEISAWTQEKSEKSDYALFFKQRHSIRHFAQTPVLLDNIKKALDLAQYTPSACNRQAWKSVVVVNKETIAQVLKNQNGNKGFGHEIDKLILVTSDLSCFNDNRELFQAFIDGGMYAMSVINSLHYYGIATIPLSASLSIKQEESVREILGIGESEVLILFIGIGNYPEHCQTTKSSRRPAEMIVK